MSAEPKCPKCSAEFTYADGNLWVCPSCAHEWSQAVMASEVEAVEDNNVYDSNRNILADGDAVTVIKELKIKGSTSAVKVGTKVKNIRLTDGGDGHNISCKIDGLGAMNLKSEFVRKVMD
jgi:protein PhnA